MPPERPRKRALAARAGLVDHYRRQVWLHHLLHAASAVHLGEVPSLLEGDANEGRYWHANGGGDHIVIAWGPAGLVAMAFDHESFDSEAVIAPELRTPERLFERAPKSLGSLVQQITAWPPADRLGSAAHWIAIHEDGRETSGSSLSESDQLKGYVVSAAEALNGDTPGLAWREMAGVTKSQAHLAEKLSRNPWVAGRVVTDPEERVLLASPPGQRGLVPGSSNVATAVKLFAQAGISWPTGVSTAGRMAGNDKDMGFALIDAVAKGDLDQVRDLVGRGARLDERSRPSELGGRWADGGATPLLLAVEACDEGITRVLLDAGARPSREDRHVPLLIAARNGSLALCQLLLERGADPRAGGQQLFRAAIAGNNPGVIDLLLDNGVVPEMSLYEHEQFLELARAAGRLDLLERFPETQEIKAERSTMIESAREHAVSNTRTIRRFARLQHIIFAMRSIHEDLLGFSQFDGTQQGGRHGFSADGASHHVIAWSEIGVVGWVLEPRRSVQTDSSSAGPAAPAEALAHAPAELRILVEVAATWSHSPKAATGAFWVHPGSAHAEGMHGWCGAGAAYFARHLEYFANPFDPRTHGWPKEALLIRKELAELASRMSIGCVLGHCDEAREAEVALILEAPRGRGAASRERVEAAAGLLAQLGMNWAEALAGGMSPAGGADGTASPRPG